MEEFQINQSLSIMSNIIPLSSESTSSLWNNPQCPLYGFVTSNRPEFTEHLINCVPKRSNNSNLETVHSPVLESPSNPGSCSSFTEYETNKADESSLSAFHVNFQNNKQDKIFREAKNCKECNFTASTKMEYWAHMRCHIKGFTCSECSFVTKYKHHMNHHWLSVHDGSKPFKCKKCLYTCVSKSMLTSHLKKHSNVYPYRCADCTYKTKFCNALKKHLRKKAHQPAVVLNADGSPNPLSIIDIYGTKRGPKQKPSVTEQEDSKSTTAVDDQFESPANQNAANNNSIAATSPYSDLAAAFNLSNHLLHKDTIRDNVQETDQFSAEYAKVLDVEEKIPKIAQSLSAAHFDVAENISEHHFDIIKTDEPSTFTKHSYNPLECREIESADAPLDLRMAEIEKSHLQYQISVGANSPKATGTSKRKGKAIKLERRLIKEDTDEETEERNGDASFESARKATLLSGEMNQKFRDIAEDEVVADLDEPEFICHYCEIIFGNIIMYTVHMGCHSFDNPYTCNVCGEECIDKISFFLHIARAEH